MIPQLGVFAGGFAREDALAVCQGPDVAGSLKRLQEASWFQLADPDAERTRYRLLPTISDYCRGRGPAAAAAARHSEHYLQILRAADAEIRAGRVRQGIPRIEPDLENIRRGMETAAQSGEHRRTLRYSQRFANFLQLNWLSAEWAMRCEQGLQAAEALGDTREVAGCQNNLGAAYAALPSGDRAANLAQAIACYENALRVFTEKHFPSDWAGTQNGLGNAYTQLPRGDRAANLAKAIACYKKALRVYTETKLPVHWAWTQNNLGIAYRNLPSGERAANLDKAIACFEAALRVRTEKDFPVDWAGTQNNLGLAYANLHTGDRAANLGQAIACFEAAAGGFDAAGMTEEAKEMRANATLLRNRR